MAETGEMVFQAPRALLELRAVKEIEERLVCRDREDCRALRDQWDQWAPWDLEGQWEKEVSLVSLDLLDPLDQRLLGLQVFQGKLELQEMKEISGQRVLLDQEEQSGSQDHQAHRDQQDQQGHKVLGTLREVGRLARQRVQLDHRDCPVCQE